MSPNDEVSAEVLRAETRLSSLYCLGCPPKLKAEFATQQLDLLFVTSQEMPALLQLGKGHAEASLPEGSVEE